MYTLRVVGGHRGGYPGGYVRERHVFPSTGGEGGEGERSSTHEFFTGAGQRDREVGRVLVPTLWAKIKCK